jgi:hypothetical protein
MLKSLKLTQDSWDIILTDLRKKHGDSISINFVMKKKLNFTRRFGEYDFPNRWVYLDFFSEQAKTIFLLKYSELLTIKEQK